VLFLISIIFLLISLSSYNANRKKDFSKGRHVLDTSTERPLRSSTRSLNAVSLSNIFVSARWTDRE
jgi:hypothetical protein